MIPARHRSLRPAFAHKGRQAAPKGPGVWNRSSEADVDVPVGTRTLQRRPARAPEQAASHSRRRRQLEVILGAAVPAALLILWQLAASAGWIDPRLYPSPWTLFMSAKEMLSSPDSTLLSDTLATLRRVIFGVVAGGFLGVVAGVGLGSVRLLRAALEPTLSALYVVPKLALLPLFMTILGLGERPLLAIVSWTVFFYVWIYTMEAVIAIPEGYLEAARSLNASWLRTLLHVTIPSALPQLFVALRVGVNVSVIMIVAAEFLVGTTGLGYLIFDSRRIFSNDAMFVGIVIVSLMGVTLAGIVAWTGRRITPWARSSRLD